LDAIWHSSFGLDETLWSTPHAMLGWGFLLVSLGLVACRLALRAARPMRWYTALVLAWLVLAASASPFLGPLQGNNTPDRVRAVASIPALAAQPPAQHTFRIYLRWNLTREHPLLIPLGALWAGAALALARQLDRRWWVFLLAVALWWLLSLLGERGDAERLDAFLVSRGQAPFGLVANRAEWLPLPLLQAALAFLVLRLARLPERWAWAAAGVLFGLVAWRTWDMPPAAALLLPLAALLALLGAALGERVYRVLERPSGRAVTRLVLCAAPGVPLLLGVVDLWLRANTP
jgi:hypothetical protein